ncbi:hypothetical protein ACI2K4_06920 [Micromonospora sp. NPDC050397]|uniref:hypothetical protein n=1 Tax=Micromonospora sp. NPDC050397 TaxID=3364279 RepID=UPI00384E7588
MGLTGWKNAGAALLLLAGLGALVGVPALVALPLPQEGPPLPADRLDIGFGATIVPPTGARLDLGDSRPGSGAVTFQADTVRLRVTAQQVTGPVEPYVAHARHKLDRNDGLLPAGAPERVRTTSGLSGERGSLRGVADDVRPGCYAVFTGHLVGVVVLATPAESCAELPEPVWAAVTSIAVEPDAS